MSSTRVPPVPVWWKNTYFWIAAALVAIGLIGLMKGDHAIRDPGQKVENGLCWMYFVAAVVMFIGGTLSHRQTLQQYGEENPSSPGSIAPSQSTPINPSSPPNHDSL